MVIIPYGEPVSVVGTGSFLYAAKLLGLRVSNVRNLYWQKFEKFGIFGIYKSEEIESEI